MTSVLSDEAEGDATHEESVGGMEEKGQGARTAGEEEGEYNTVQYNRIEHNTRQCSTVQHDTVRRSTTECIIK